MTKLVVTIHRPRTPFFLLGLDTYLLGAGSGVLLCASTVLQVGWAGGLLFAAAVAWIILDGRYESEFVAGVRHGQARSLAHVEAVVNRWIAEGLLDAGDMEQLKRAELEVLETRGRE